MFRHVPNLLAAGVLAVATTGTPIATWPARPASDCPPGDYQASSGDCVPDPEKLPPNDARPRGATAICEDGTYSFSEHPYSGGTCHGHGGVGQHLTSRRTP
jgi:hypothetical protein